MGCDQFRTWAKVIEKMSLAAYPRRGGGWHYLAVVALAVSITGVDCGIVPTTKELPSPGTNASSSSPESAVYSYWTLLEQHNYPAAYNYLTPGEQQRAGGLAAFEASYEKDAVESANIHLTVISISGDRATVAINSSQVRTTFSGCRIVSGSYQLANLGSGWLIDYESLSAKRC